MTRHAPSLRSGSLYALAAALSFGSTIPVVAHFGAGASAFATAALLYLGACLSGLLGAGQRFRQLKPLRTQLLRVTVVAVLGAALAPALFAWGLQHAGATAGSLLLNLEAAFTLLLARVIYHESLSRRAALALAVMTLAGSVLALGAAHHAAGVRGLGLGLLALTCATFCWALDNTLTRALAALDPVQVVTLKSGLGMLLTAAVTWVMGDALPAPLPAAMLVAAGVVGYGLSLRLYLLAQRGLGAARTASIFAAAPFIGTLCAVLLWHQRADWWTWSSAMLFGIGITLHLRERHSHRHHHQALEHEHAHRHDDGHHAHRHDGAVIGEHSHRHHHQALEHEHEHGFDLHHDHHRG